MKIRVVLKRKFKRQFEYLDIENLFFSKNVLKVRTIDDGCISLPMDEVKYFCIEVNN